MTNVLVVDSERSIRNTLKERLEYDVERHPYFLPESRHGASLK